MRCKAKTQQNTKKDNITDNTVSNRIQKMAEKNNISYQELDNRNSDSDDVSIITNVHEKRLLVWY